MFNLHFDQHFIIFDGNTFQNYISHKKIKEKRTKQMENTNSDW